MDKLDTIFILFFVVLIAIAIKEKKDLIIPAKTRKVEFFIGLLGIIIFLMITILKAKTWIHYIIGMLAVIELILMITKEGITSKGFNSLAVLSIYNNWNKIDYVEISMEKDSVKVLFPNTSLRRDFSYYDKKYYDKIINILSKNLPREKIRMK